MKRDNPENGLEEAADYSKQLRISNFATDESMASCMQEFDEVQKRLQELDEECAREQMVIQKKYDQEKRPLFDKRQELIERLPGFWCHTFQNHPGLPMIEEDINVLQHLKRVDLEDNIDDNGSYAVSFVFDEGAMEYMEFLTIVKRVTFKNNEEAMIDCTEIKWKENKSPVEIAKQRRKEKKDVNGHSFFEWFTKNPMYKPTLGCDVGEIIRREIWHAPLAYYTEEIGRDRDCYDDDDDEHDDNGGGDDDDDAFEDGDDDCDEGEEVDGEEIDDAGDGKDDDAEVND